MRLTALITGATLLGTFMYPATTVSAAQNAVYDYEKNKTKNYRIQSTETIKLLSEENQEVPKVVLVEFVLAAEKSDEEATSEKSQPEEYEVKRGDTLTSISKTHEIKWERIWQKNTQIIHPDRLQEGMKLAIPADDEDLEPKELPAEEPAVVATPKPAAAPRPSTAPQRQAPRRQAQAPVRENVQRPAAPAVSRGSSAGNTYAPGWCTWYAKNRRPDLPNNLGNANTWLSRAAAQGIPTGSAPRAGAIGQRGMHVVYVESVNGNGTVNISEMNYSGLYVISTRTVPAGYFQYIY
jgi:surface antigen